jgi:hypothetical protein
MRRDPFPFVLDELQPIRPTVKRAFGLTYVYLDEWTVVVYYYRAR